MSETVTEEQKQRRREYSYAHWLKTKCVHRGKPQKKIPALYGCSVQPLNGEVILIGPFKNKQTAMVNRMKTVRKLLEENNASEFDIKCLALFEHGYFEEQTKHK